MDLERRAFVISELRASGGKQPRISGHAAVFNKLSDDLGGFREKVAPGAFKESIRDGDVRALWNHDPNFPLARTTNKTLRLEEDEVGLKFEADLLDEPFEAGLIRRIERGDVSQMSFGFMVLPDGQAWRMEEGGLVRTLTKVELFDVSPVTYPAYPQTDVSVRELAVEMRKKFSAQDTEFAQRVKARADYIASRTLPEDSLSLSAIIKSASRKTGI